MDARNRTSHTYHKATADKVLSDIQDFGVEAQKLLGVTRLEVDFENSSLPFKVDLVLRSRISDEF